MHLNKRFNFNEQCEILLTEANQKWQGAQVVNEVLNTYLINFLYRRTLYLHRKHIQFDMYEIVLKLARFCTKLTCVHQNLTGNRLRSLSKYLFKSYLRFIFCYSLSKVFQVIYINAYIDSK